MHLFEETSKTDVSSLMADNKVLQKTLEEQTFRRRVLYSKFFLFLKFMLKTGINRTFYYSTGMVLDQIFSMFDILLKLKINLYHQYF